MIVVYADGSNNTKVTDQDRLNLINAAIDTLAVADRELGLARSHERRAYKRPAPTRRAIPACIRRVPRNRAHRATASRPTTAATSTSPPGSSEGPSGDPDPPLDNNFNGQLAQGALNAA